MTELSFKGKEFVYNHHLSVPIRPLVPHADKGIGEVALDGNLIVHGDNLHALKALLPMYAGKVDCIFIDPPYNTGNEGWAYSDNVNAPMIREWLAANPIGAEDGLRHDKWCAMMWPRLRLLHELLADRGSIWITLDDNEVHRARSILDEVFGEHSLVGQIAWQKRTSRENRATLSPSFDHVICYSKPLKDTWKNFRNKLAASEDGYSNPDGDNKGPWASIPFSAQGHRDNQVYKITSPSGVVLSPPKGRCWGATEKEFIRLKDEGRVYWPRGGKGRPRIKQYEFEAKGLVPDTLWASAEVGTTEDSKKEIMAIVSDDLPDDFHAPKPTKLVQRILDIATNENSFVLDSFAGSGTTAHAVLAANARDSGNRRFILCEMEDYADTLTAERVRRVINGYAFKGTQREELLRENLTWSKLKKADALVETVAKIETEHGDHFDRIKPTVKDGTLIVTGERDVNERTEGLGGTFTYCTLGPAIEMDKVLTGDELPPFAALGAALFHTATNRAFDPKGADRGRYYLGQADDRHIWLLYKPDLEWLKSTEAALTLAQAERIAGFDAEASHLVFAPARFVSNALLRERGLKVEFVPLPFALYRFERG